MASMNILVTLDHHYITPLRVMLFSLFLNNPEHRFQIYLLHSDLQAEDIAELQTFCTENQSQLTALYINEHMFKEAPVFRHYTRAMYYRLLAYHLLPAQMERILYLDPDILVINDLAALYHTELQNYLYAAAIHTGLTGFSEHVNRIRLGTYEADGYYNSGVLLMNLAVQRKTIREQDIYAFAKIHKNELILPDQDILNSLYAEQITPLDDSMYNYDARKYQTYLLVSGGLKDINWVMKHTVLLHYCGKNKPWNHSYHNRFGTLYKHYQQLTARAFAKMHVTSSSLPVVSDVASDQPLN